MILHIFHHDPEMWVNSTDILYPYTGYQFSKRKANLINLVPSDYISGMVMLLTITGMGKNEAL